MSDNIVVGHTGRLTNRIAYPVALSDLSSEARAVLEAALAMTPGGLGSYRVVEAARAFAAKVKEAE